MSPAAPDICIEVEGPGVSDDDILIISEDTLDVPQNLSWSETFVSQVTVQILNPALYWYHDIYLKLDETAYQRIHCTT